MNKNDYINLSTNIKVREKSMIDGPTWSRLIEAEDIGQFYTVLGDSFYGEVLKGSRSRDDFDSALDTYLVDLYQDFYKKTPDPEIVEILGADYLFHNLKVLVKSYLLGEDLSRHYFEIRDQDLDVMAEDLGESGQVKKDREFAHQVNFALKIYKQTKDPQRLDMSLDRFKNEYMLSIAKDIGNDPIEAYVKNLIDIQNLDMVLRGQNEDNSVNKVAQFLTRGGNIPIDILIDNYFEGVEGLIKALRPYDIFRTLESGLEAYKKDGDIAHFRDVNHAYLFDILRKDSKVTYGPELVFDYILRRENEVKALRIANVGKLNQMDINEIKRRVDGQIA